MKDELYCCHACGHTFKESANKPVLDCRECGETFSGSVFGQPNKTMKARSNSQAYPSQDDGGQCPMPACDGCLEGHIGCPKCGAGIEDVGPICDGCADERRQRGLDRRNRRRKAHHE